MRNSVMRLTVGKELSLCVSEKALVVFSPLPPPLSSRSPAKVNDTATVAPPPLAREVDGPPHAGLKEKRAYFVEHVMSHHPCAFFCDVLIGWGSLLQAEGRSDNADAILADVPLRERQLLNGKLYDPCFDTADVVFPLWDTRAHLTRTNEQTRLKRDANPARGGVRTDTHAGLGDDGSPAHINEPQSQPTREDLQQPGGLFYHYSLVHFAAELNSMSCIEFALARLPNGVPFVPRDEPPSVHPGVPLVPRRSDQRVRPSVDWIACHGADFTGAFPSHLAAASGSVDVLDWLATRYGAEHILQQQRMGTSLRSGHTDAGSAKPHRRGGLTAVGRALAEGQLTTLEWLFERHPTIIEGATSPQHVEATLVTAAARSGEGCARSLQFLLDHDLFQGRSPTVSLSSLYAFSEAPQISIALRAMGCRRVLFAAAEAGNASALAWFLRRFGDQILLVQDSVGATVIHHCARGGQCALLRALLQPEGGRHSGTEAGDADLLEALSDAVPAAARRALIDAPDNEGRTPAVWCILGSTRPVRKVETLTCLLSLGSTWPQYTNESGHTLRSLAGHKHSPFSPLCLFIERHTR